MNDAVERLARRFADGAASLAEVEAEYRQLLIALAGRDARFAFDREGRPGAVAAVRDALPLMERDLFDAIVEDHACEVAAIEEALVQLARAIRRSPGSGGSSRPSTTDTASAPTKIHNAT